MGGRRLKAAEGQQCLHSKSDHGTGVIPRRRHLDRERARKARWRRLCMESSGRGASTPFARLRSNFRPTRRARMKHPGTACVLITEIGLSSRGLCANTCSAETPDQEPIEEVEIMLDHSSYRVHSSFALFRASKNQRQMHEPPG